MSNDFDYSGYSPEQQIDARVEQAAQQLANEFAVMMDKFESKQRESSTTSRLGSLELAVKAASHQAWDHAHTLFVAREFEKWVLLGDNPDNSDDSPSD